VVADLIRNFSNYFAIFASCFFEPANVEFEPAEKWQEQARKAAAKP